MMIVGSFGGFLIVAREVASMHVFSKRRMIIGVAGMLTAFSVMGAGSVAAAGVGHGTVDVNDVTKQPHRGLVFNSDGGERNLQPDVLHKFLYEEFLENVPLRVQPSPDDGAHPGS